MFAERLKIVPIGSYEDYNANVDLNSIKMTNFHRATILVLFHEMDVAVCTVKVYSGATDGSKDSALTFRYAYGGAAEGAANCDVLSAWSTSAALDVAHTKDDYLLVIDITGSEMDMANNEEWLTVELTDSAGGATGRASAIALLEPRFTGNRSATALA